eukprot:RCo050649
MADPSSASASAKRRAVDSCSSSAEPARKRGRGSFSTAMASCGASDTFERLQEGKTTTGGEEPRQASGLGTAQEVIPKEGPASCGGCARAVLRGVPGSVSAAVVQAQVEDAFAVLCNVEKRGEVPGEFTVTFASEGERAKVTQGPALQFRQAVARWTLLRPKASAGAAPSSFTARPTEETEEEKLRRLFGIEGFGSSKKETQ